MLSGLVAQNPVLYCYILYVCMFDYVNVECLYFIFTLECIQYMQNVA